MAEEEKFASLKLMAALSGVEAKVKEYIEDWVLLTYDLPHNEAGDKVRAKFLDDVRSLGGIQHSESCYLFPASPVAELAVISVAEAGKAYIWFSSVEDEEKARKLTQEYDKKVKDDFLKELKERITKMKKHAEEGKDGIVEKMRKKTDRMLKDAAGIAARRGSEKLAREVEKLKSELDGIQVSPSGWVSELKNLL